MLGHLNDFFLLLGLGAVGQIMTNFDNLALLVALIPTLGRRAAIFAFWAAQGVMLCLAIATAQGIASSIGDPGGWAAILPIGLGLWRLLYSEAPKTNLGKTYGSHSGRWLAGFILFLLLTGDSFAVMTPLLADTVPHLRWLVVVGACATVVTLGILASHLVRFEGLAKWIDKAAPYAMIVIGLYILWNSQTDMTV